MFTSQKRGQDREWIVPDTKSSNLTSIRHTSLVPVRCSGGDTREDGSTDGTDRVTLPIPSLLPSSRTPFLRRVMGVDLCGGDDTWSIHCPVSPSLGSRDTLLKNRRRRRRTRSCDQCSPSRPSQVPSDWEVLRLCKSRSHGPPKSRRTG